MKISKYKCGKCNNYTYKTIQSGLNSTFNSIETIKLTGGTRKIPVYIYEVRH